MSLGSADCVKLVDQLIHSLDKPDAELDRLWAEEAESRLVAYKSGKLKAVSIEEVLAKNQTTGKLEGNEHGVLALD